MIRYLRNSKLDAGAQRHQLDLLTALNEAHRSAVGQDAFSGGAHPSDGDRLSHAV